MSMVPRPVTHRWEYLDGLRGLAAFSVAITHYKNDIPVEATVHHELMAWTFQPPYLALFNGPFAVCTFFVLSGFVLAQSAGSGKATLFANMVTRYFRLTVPMLTCLIFAWFLYTVFRGAIPHPETMRDFARNVFHASPSGFLAAVEDALYGVYLLSIFPLNIALWTMKFEFVGSIGIYLFYAFIPAAHRLKLLPLVGVLALLRPFFLGFVLGAMLREIWTRRPAWIAHAGWTGWGALALAIYFMAGGQFGTPVDLANDVPHGSHAFFSPVLYAFGAAAAVYAILILPVLQRLMSSYAPQFLGYISFALYLLHMPFLIVIQWVYLHTGGPPLVRMLALLPFYLAVILPLAWLMTRWVDDPLLSLLKRWKVSLSALSFGFGRRTTTPVKP